MGHCQEEEEEHEALGSDYDVRRYPPRHPLLDESNGTGAEPGDVLLVARGEASSHQQSPQRHPSSRRRKGPSTP